MRSLGPDTPKTDLFRLIAEYIDRQIFAGYRLYPGNYVALDLLQGGSAYAGHYTEAERAAFEHYLDGQMAKVTIPNKDNDFLRGQLLRMYANPAINQLGL